MGCDEASELQEARRFSVILLDNLCLTCKPWEGRTCPASSPVQGFFCYTRYSDHLREGAKKMYALC